MNVKKPIMFALIIVYQFSYQEYTPCLLNLPPSLLTHRHRNNFFGFLDCMYFQATMTKRINKYTHMFISTYVVVWKLHFLLASTKWNEYMIFFKWYSPDDGKTCN